MSQKQALFLVQKSTLSTQIKVLLIDDKRDITEPIRVCFRNDGIEVDAYNDPVEASSAFKPSVYSLAILDINISKMNGFHVYRELRMIDSSITVCFFTTFDVYESEFKKLFPEVDAHLFIKKPVTISVLRSRVNELLKVVA